MDEIERILWRIPEMTAIEQLREAIEDSGSHSEYHYEIMNRHRSEWPRLWEAIDRLLKEN